MYTLTITWYKIRSDVKFIFEYNTKLIQYLLKLSYKVRVFDNWFSRKLEDRFSSQFINSSTNVILQLKYNSAVFIKKLGSLEM